MSLVLNAKLAMDRVAPGKFGVGFREEAEYADAIRAVVRAVADWLDERATREEVERGLTFPRDNFVAPRDVIDEVVRRIHVELVA